MDTRLQLRASRSLTHCVLSGIASIGIASLLVFGMWAWAGGKLYRALTEGGTYALWAVVFIVVGAGGLRRIAPRNVSAKKFFLIFLAAFGAYAFAWSAIWFAWQNRAGEWTAALVGTAAFCAVLCGAFKSWKFFPRATLVVFALHCAGYFAGGWMYDFVLGRAAIPFPPDLLGKSARADLSKLLWGVGYGVGFGAGIGYAFWECRDRTGEQPPLTA